MRTMKRIFLVCLMTVCLVIGMVAASAASPAMPGSVQYVAALRSSRSSDSHSSDDDKSDLQSQVTLNSEKIHTNKLSTDADIQELQGELRSVQNILKVFFVGILVSLCLNIALVYYIKRHRL